MNATPPNLPPLRRAPRQRASKPVPKRVLCGTAMSQATGTVAALCVLSTHGVPLLIRCVGDCAPPKREMVGILNAVFQSVKQQSLGAVSAATECVSLRHPACSVHAPR